MNDFTFSITQQMITKIVADEDEETLKVIQKYCKENDIIPNIISENKLRLVLKLGIAELKKYPVLESEVN